MDQYLRLLAPSGTYSAESMELAAAHIKSEVRKVGPFKEFVDAVFNKNPDMISPGSPYLHYYERLVEYTKYAPANADIQFYWQKYCRVYEDIKGPGNQNFSPKNGKNEFGKEKIFIKTPMP